MNGTSSRIRANSASTTRATGAGGRPVRGASRVTVTRPYEGADGASSSASYQQPHAMVGSSSASSSASYQQPRAMVGSSSASSSARQQPGAATPSNGLRDNRSSSANPPRPDLVHGAGGTTAAGRQTSTQRAGTAGGGLNAAVGPAVPQAIHTIPSGNELLLRIQRRGGLWGVRTLRLALANGLQRYRLDVENTLAGGVGGGGARAPPMPRSSYTTTSGGGGATRGAALQPHILPPIQLQAPTPTSLPIAYVLAALEEYGVKGVTEEYLLYWLGPQVVRDTVGGVGTTNAPAATTPIIVVVPPTSASQPRTPVYGQISPTGNNLFRDPLSGGGSGMRLPTNKAPNQDPPQQATNYGYSYNRTRSASSPGITAALRPQNYLAERGGGGSTVNGSADGSTSSASTPSFADSCFLDIELLMRLVGCWLTVDRLRVVNACYTVLLERLGKRIGGGGGGGGGYPLSGGPSAAADARSSLAAGIKIPSLVNATTMGGASVTVTLRDLITHLDIVVHPYCVDGTATRLDALLVFYAAWGLDNKWNGGGVGGGGATEYLRNPSAGVRNYGFDLLSGAQRPVHSEVSTAPVSRELFCQYHADMLVSYTDSQFAQLMPALWGLSKATIAAVPSPTPPLTRAETNKLFATMDKNKNGILSLAELDAEIALRFPQYNHKPLIMRAYRLADKNNSGHISPAEFHRFVVYIAHIARFSDLFRKLDTDGSRTLSLEELVAGKALLGLPDAPNSRLRALFVEIDRNHGGKIVFEEFVTALLKHYPPPELTM